MKSQSLIKGAAVVAAGSLLSKLLGAVYRILLMDALGGRGMGIYQMVFPLYCLLLTLSATGIPSALARMVAERAASGGDGRPVLAAALPLFAGDRRGQGASPCLRLRPPLPAVQGEAAAASAYRMLAPSVLLVAAVSCLRGWFQGHSRFAPTAASEVIEQAVKIAFGLLFVQIYRGDAARAVAFAALAITLSEFAALIFLAVCAGGYPRGSLLVRMRRRTWGIRFAGRGAFCSARSALCSLSRSGREGQVRPSPHARIAPRRFARCRCGGRAAPLQSHREHPHRSVDRAVCGERNGTVRPVCGRGDGARQSARPCLLRFGGGQYPRRFGSARGGAGREAEERALFALKCTLYLALPAAALLFAFPGAGLRFAVPPAGRGDGGARAAGAPACPFGRPARRGAGRSPPA